MSSTSPSKRPALSNRVSQLINSFNDQGSHTEGQPGPKPSQSRVGKEDGKRYQGQWSFHESPDLHRQSSAKIGLGGFLGFSNSNSHAKDTNSDSRRADHGQKHRKKSSPSGSSHSRSTTRAEAKLDHEIPLVSEASGDADNANAGLNATTSDAPKLSATSPAPQEKTSSKARKSSKSKHHRTSSQPTILVEDTDTKNQQDHPRGRKSHKASPPRVQTWSKPKQSQSADPKRPTTSDGASPKHSSWNMFNLFTPSPHTHQRSKSQDPSSLKGAHTRKVSGDLRPHQTRHRRNLSAPHAERTKIYSRKNSSGHVTIHVHKHENAKHLDDLERNDWRAGLAHRLVGDLY